MNWQEIWQLLSWRDLLDVAIVAVVFYNLLLPIRGTRAVQMISGILIVAAMYFVARRANLAALETLLSSLLLFLPFAVIVLFQHEIRRVLASMGRNPLWSRGSRQRLESTIDEVALAAAAMAARRVGALIVIERHEGLRNYVESGIRLDAAVSFDLLVNIFAPDTPLHDGAAIVQSDRIAAGASFLPLSASAELSKDFGTRHRAALGISEETDAVAVVVSEETGAISVAFGGKLTRNLDSGTLRALLHKLLVAEIHLSRRGGGAA